MPKRFVKPVVITTDHLFTNGVRNWFEFSVSSLQSKNTRNDSEKEVSEEVWTQKTI